MSNEDGSASSLNSTDTKLYLDELKALNQSGSSYSGTVNSGEIGGSGDATLSQLMRTIYSSEPKQKIMLPGNNENDHSFSVYGREVDIYIASSDGSPRAGSNKVKITSVVNHAWEQRYYYGNLVAVHRDGDYVAFALKGKFGGNVRILNRRTAERALLKGFMGSVVDVAFAHSEDVIVAAIDEVGNLFVYTLESGQDGKIVMTPLLQLHQQASRPCEYHRVIWCPYWPEEGEEGEGFLQDSSKVLAYTLGEKIELLAVDIVTRDYGAGPLNPADIESGKISLVCHTQPIVDAVFSPDGSALATASLDGDVKFFQIDWQETADPPRCLHQWKPHNGQPLSFFAFLDDLKNMSPDAQFWKFAVTGCNKNQELKVWSCETWSCLQTVRFLSPPDGVDHEPPTLKAAIDPSARYIVLSDKLHMVVYVLQLHQDVEAGTAHISSVSEFPLTQPCLSFAILEACTKRFKPSPNDSHLDEITTGELEQEVDQSQNFCDEETKDSTTGVQIRLYAVHTRALQELLIRYRPESSVSVLGSASSVSHDGTSLRDGLSDMSMGAETSFADSEMTGEDVSAALVVHPQPKLLSPEAFTVSSSSKLASPSGGLGANTTTEDVLSSTSSFTHVTGLTGQNAEDLLLSPASSADHSASAAGLSPKSGASAQSPKSAILSPKSAILSPKSAILSPKSLFSTPTMKNGKMAGDADQDVTPTNIPLPPEEEDELATPKSSHQSHDSSQMDALEAFLNPPTSCTASSQPPGETPINTGTFQVDSLTQESAVAGAADSTGAGDTYDENDQEVAEVLGEDPDKSFSSVGSGTASGPPAEYPLDQAADEDRPHKPWPRPPDVPAGPQAIPVAPESLPQSADEAVETLGAEAGDGDGDGEDDYSEDQNETEVEEEIEEVLEEADDDDDRDDEGRDFQKPYREVNAGAGSQAPVQIIREVLDRSMLTEVMESLGKLAAQVNHHQEEMCRMQRQIVEQHEMQMDLQRQQLEQYVLRSAAQPTKDLEQQLGRVQNVVASRVERTLSTALQRETKLLHDRLTSSESRQAAAQESLQKGVTQALGLAAHKSLETIVKNEFKQNVTPAVTRAVDQMKSNMHTELSQKMTATDSVIKEQIGKIVRGRQMTDAVGQAAASALHGPMQSLLRDVVQNRVVPAFEHSTQTMANQVNSAFQEGTKEYLAHLRKQLEKVRQEQLSARDPLVAQLTGLVESLKQNSHQLQNQIVQAVRSETSTQIKASLASLQEQLSAGLRGVIREEVAAALREQNSKMTDSLASYLRSGAGTPVPGAHTPDLNTVQALQDQVKLLVNRGRISDAFQTALTASNLEVVLYVCELVNPEQLFSQSPCPLSQPVLLSLIQQLSAELKSSFATKIKFLTEAVTTLDPKDPVTQEHVPVVLDSLVVKLRTYQASNPPSRDVRLLLMAANSLLATR